MINCDSKRSSVQRGAVATVVVVVDAALTGSTESAAVAPTAAIMAVRRRRSIEHLLRFEHSTQQFAGLFGRPLSAPDYVGRVAAAIILAVVFSSVFIAAYIVMRHPKFGQRRRKRR
jgi:hypothetical protein